MASSIITIFRWSIFRLSSIILVTLWVFNPLGSQASFRGAYLQSSIGTSQGNITYYNPDISIQFLLSSFGSAGARSIPTTRAIYTTTLYDYVTSVQYVDPTNNVTQAAIAILGGESSAAVRAAIDPWGNVRIPSLQYHSDYDVNNPQKWLQTPWNERMMNYSSLVGDRIDGLNRSFGGNTSFQASSSFQIFDVSVPLYFSSLF